MDIDLKILTEDEVYSLYFKVIEEINRRKRIKECSNNPALFEWRRKNFGNFSNTWRLN